MPGRSRYFLPTIFSIVGIGGAISAIWLNTNQLPSTIDFIPFYQGTLWTDILTVFVLAIPIIALEYIILCMPLTALFLVASKIVKGVSYDINILELGKNFGSLRIIRRAAAPAFFAVSFAGIFIKFIEELIFGARPTVPEELWFTYPVTLTLMASLILMPVALALFIPTWLLNDAGIVSHLDEKQLDVRQPPHTEGVGRWYYNMLGGYALIVFPITMFLSHFYEPFIVNPLNYSVELMDVVFAALFTLGAPVMVMGFITPVVMLNERLLNWSTGKIQGFAKWLGTKEVIRARITERMKEQPSDETPSNPDSW